MSDLLGYAGWYILPNLVTGWVQSAFYALWIRAGDPKPQPGSRQFVKDRRRIYVLVVLTYLCYTIYEADWKLQVAGDFYRNLGAPLDADDRVINNKFRRLTVTYHPDKVAQHVNRQWAEAVYVQMQQSRDVLIDPAKRFAYDRFGPRILDWRLPKTVSDYIWSGLWESGLYYFGTVSVLATLGVVGYMKSASFWRYNAVAAMFAIELYTTTRPEPPMFLSHVINPFLTTFTNHPPYLQFQLLSLLRNVLLSLFIALTQVGPVLFPPTPSEKEATPEQLNRLEVLAKASEQEANRLFGLEMTPFAGNPAALQDLRAAMRNWLVDNTVKANPQVRDAMGRVLQPRGGAQIQGH